MNIPEDKVLHFLVGLIIAVIAYAVTGVPWVSFAVCLAAGMGKEYWDYKHEGHVADYWDAIATAAPGLIVYLLATSGGMHVHP